MSRARAFDGQLTRAGRGRFTPHELTSRADASIWLREVGHVGTRDQQQQPDGAEKNGSEWMSPRGGGSEVRSILTL
jgi:hypothetical protein